LDAIRTGFTGIVEDVMRLELHYRSDIDLSQPAMQVQIRSHIARYLRDFPQSGEGVITLGGVEHCFMYIVQDDVVETVIAARRRDSQSSGGSSQKNTTTGTLSATHTSMCSIPLNRAMMVTP
jgi:hypothetical protein